MPRGVQHGPFACPSFERGTRCSWAARRRCARSSSSDCAARVGPVALARAFSAAQRDAACATAVRGRQLRYDPSRDTCCLGDSSSTLAVVSPPPAATMPPKATGRSESTARVVVPRGVITYLGGGGTGASNKGTARLDCSAPSPGSRAALGAALRLAAARRCRLARPLSRARSRSASAASSSILSLRNFGGLEGLSPAWPQSLPSAARAPLPPPSIQCTVVRPRVFGRRDIGRGGARRVHSPGRRATPWTPCHRCRCAGCGPGCSAALVSFPTAMAEVRSTLPTWLRSWSTSADRPTRTTRCQQEAFAVSRAA